MNETIMILDKLDSMGGNALTAFIWYLIMDYTPVWAIIGLLTWGVRTVWKHEKDKNIKF
jgi:hypothetical protein